MFYIAIQNTFHHSYPVSLKSVAVTREAKGQSAPLLDGIELENSEQN